MSRATICTVGASVLALALVAVVEPPSGVPLADPDGDVRASALDRQLRECEHRRTARREIALAVAEGRLAFDDGASAFLAMLAEIPGEADVARHYFRGATDAERAGQQLLAFVRELDLPYGRREEVVARLAAEFAAHFGRPPEPTG